MKKQLLLAIATSLACMAFLLTGCSQPQASNSKQSDSHLTVYLWQNTLLEDLAPYIKQQMPDSDIEFIVGNNNVDLYCYLQEHGELPDVITTRRFSANDAKELQPYLLDFTSYDITSEYSPYALQYYKNSNGNIQWLPVCGIPETTIVNKSLLERHGLSIPKNYQQFAQLCKELSKQGVKPYTCELASDWASHSVLQGSAIDQFESIEGIEWRSNAESAQDEIAFNDELWNQIFKEANKFVKDTGLTEKDNTCTMADAKAQFTSGNAAMFRGTPEVMEALQGQMSDELVRLPYFSQTSDESWVYTYASMNVALNKNLESNKEKLDKAMEVLSCFNSEQGQQIIAGGNGCISYNANVSSKLDGMIGIEDEVRNNQFYIRYASNNSFPASMKVIQGLADGSMDESQAYAAFKEEMNSTSQEESVVTFNDHYALSPNSNGAREAASSILSTVRESTGTQLAFTPYSYYASSIYEGPCTKKQLSMLTAQNDDAKLFKADLTGQEVKQVVQRYLDNTTESTLISSRYELPIASGMKLELDQDGSTFKVKNILVNGNPINDEETYSILLSSRTINALNDVKPDNASQKLDVSLSKVWTQAIEGGNQPAKPEDYLSVA